MFQNSSIPVKQISNRVLSERLSSLMMGEERNRSTHRTLVIERLEEIPIQDERSGRIT
jgi:hypothetical protein